MTSVLNRTWIPGWWSHQLSSFWDLWSPGCVFAASCTLYLYHPVFSCSLVARCPPSLWRKKRETAATLQSSHTANRMMYLQYVWTVWSIYSCSHVDTVSWGSTQAGWVLSRRLGESYESPVVLWASVHLHDSVVNTSLFVSSEGRDGPLSCREEVLTTSWVLIRKGRLAEALSVNIPQVWERQRKGAGEEEGSGWIAALYGQSSAFPRVCGSDPRHDARCCTNSLSVPPSGETLEMLHLSLIFLFFFLLEVFFKHNYRW